jgi:hypothetical protein
MTQRRCDRLRGVDEQLMRCVSQSRGGTSQLSSSPLPGASAAAGLCQHPTGGLRIYNYFNRAFFLITYLLTVKIAVEFANIFIQCRRTAQLKVRVSSRSIRPISVELIEHDNNDTPLLRVMYTFNWNITLAKFVSSQFPSMTLWFMECELSAGPI